MLPRLYEGKTDISNYKSNGLGFFNSVKRCEVTEERNGEFFLELEIYENDRLRNKVSPGMIIKAKPNNIDNLQLDDISIDKYGNLSLTALHIKSVFMKNATAEIRSGDSIPGTPAEVFDILSSSLALDNIFTFYSDISNTADFKKGLLSGEMLEDIFYSDDGGMLDVFGGELYFDNFSISLLKKRGHMTDKVIRYGSNISDYNQTITSAEIYTHILPYAEVENLKDNDTIRVSANPIPTGANLNEFQKILPVDFSKKCKKYKVNSSNGVGYADLNTRLIELGNKRVEKKKERLTQPTVNIAITYTPILNDLQDIQLCDRVKVVYGDNVTTAKAVKMVYNCIQERYVNIEFGEKKLNLTDLIKVG